MSKFDINKKLLTVKELAGLTDQRLDEYRKSFRKPLGFLKNLRDENELTHDQHKKFKQLKNHYDNEILAECDKRKHFKK